MAESDGVTHHVAVTVFGDCVCQLISDNFLPEPEGSGHQ